uniref:Phosphomevalonate kinase n=1 Tax=Aceria tosichella TaxID=561515 RepID=A0A6G1SER0_9ACAR
MYQIIGIINRFMYGPSQDAAETVSNWHNRREYADDSGSEDETTTASSSSTRNRAIHGRRTNDDDDDDYIPTNLKLVILLSGKRKSGKDHISTLITNYIGYQRMHQLAILRIAGPIKKEFAKNNKLDFTRLLDSSDYKENFRMAMVEWSEAYREREGWNCFLKLAIKEQRAKDKAIWILNDARRPCDLEYFEDESTFGNTRIIKLRIEATDEARLSRGWTFTKGIDDRPTECGLDDYDDWTYVINNDYNDRRDSLVESLKPIYDEIDQVLQSN